MSTITIYDRTTRRNPTRSPSPELTAMIDTIADAPADENGWLLLADFLEDKGETDIAEGIRSLMAEKPCQTEFSLTRSADFWTNGAMHTESMTLHFGRAGWSHIYWANGMWSDTMDASAAKNLLLSWAPRYSKKAKALHLEAKPRKAAAS